MRRQRTLDEVLREINGIMKEYGDVFGGAYITEEVERGKYITKMKVKHSYNLGILHF